MSHTVAGVIAASETLTSFARRHALPAPVPLTSGLALLPVRDTELDAFLPLPLTGTTPGFVYLSDQLIAALASASATNRVMYFETAYVGGVGSQAAIVLHHGTIIHGPESGRIGPINRALAFLGVTVQSPATDEFDMVGLGRHRSTADWLGVGVDEDDD